MYHLVIFGIDEDRGLVGNAEGPEETIVLCLYFGVGFARAEVFELLEFRVRCSLGWS